MATPTKVIKLLTYIYENTLFFIKLIIGEILKMLKEEIIYMIFT